MEKTIEQIANSFEIKGKILEITPLGDGNINDTYRVRTEEGCPDYVLQRINHAIFTDVELLQNNIERITSHIRKCLIEEGQSDIDRKVLTLVKLKGSDRTYCCEDGNYWRMTVLIRDSYTHNEVTPESSYDTGKAFGKFEAMLAPITLQLGQTIPDFHNMELRARQMTQAVNEDKAGRMSDPKVQEAVEFLMSHMDRMCMAERLHKEGKLPKRVCHCDTKVNNMLFDADGKVLCIIDLDTTMPSFVFSDLGDFMRTAGSTLAEDDPDYDKVALRMDIFKAFTKGYLESATFLTPTEKENLPFATLLFPFMQAVRFLTDYINGDTYYKIKYPEHNMVRTLNQIALFKSAMAQLPQMQEYIK